MDSALLVMALVLLAAAVFVGIWSPGRDGRQLRPVRALAERRGAHCGARHRA
jgi:hypothetical protein